MAFAVHIGLDRTDMTPEVLGTLRSARVLGAFPRTVCYDGDGWNCWGEEPGTDVNDDRTLLVSLLVSQLGDAINLADALMAHMRGALVASSADQHGGRDLVHTLVAVTDADDFSTDLYTIDAVHGRRTHTNPVR